MSSGSGEEAALLSLGSLRNQRQAGLWEGCRGSGGLATLGLEMSLMAQTMRRQVSEVCAHCFASGPSGLGRLVKGVALW